MARYTVKQGRRYQANVRLGLLQSVASNEAVAEKFREVGFTDVVVTGSGRTRRAEGAWRLKDASADVPDEVHEVREIGLIET